MSDTQSGVVGGDLSALKKALHKANYVKWTPLEDQDGGSPSAPVMVHPARPNLKLGRVDALNKGVWDTFTPKQQWDVLTAMRGPDYQGSRILKWLTTGVLRTRMRKVFRPEGSSAVRNETLQFMIVPQSRGVHLFHPFDIAHFLGHVVEAAMIIGVDYLQVDPIIFDRGLTDSPNYLFRLLADQDPQSRDFWRTASTIG